jgi:hypothetical protein
MVLVAEMKKVKIRKEDVVMKAEALLGHEPRNVGGS